MKHFAGAVSATLFVAVTVGAQAGPLVLPGAGGSSLYQAVSDLGEPYYSEVPPPPPAPIPPPAPRYGYGPAPDYGYRPPAPVYGPDPYRPDYRPDYSYAPALLPVHEVYAIIRDHGFSPLGEPRQRGYTYVIAVLDRDGEDGRLVIDARSGRIIRFVPAFQWGEDYERMRYEPGRDRPGPVMPRDSLDRMPPTVIKADPHLLQASPATPAGPRMASRTTPAAPKVTTPAARPAATTPQSAAVQAKDIEAKPAEMKPADAKPAQQAAAATAQQPAPAATSPQAPTQQVQAPQILPTETMPPAQGLE